jgi:cytochrome d ubiquinol oxidase subunit I
MTATGWDRLQFAFTITYHYLFPQLTMGLGLLILVMKLLAMRAPAPAGTPRPSGAREAARTPVWDELARFFARLFGVNFAIGVVTGIPMEFQFGTNWARFSRYAGGVVGMTLALEGMFAFFAESAFLGAFLYGERRLSRRAHLGAAVMLWLGSWLSGYFIVVTNAFMQHPVGHAVRDDGTLTIEHARTYLLNPWALWEYAHTMSAAVVTGAFVVTAIGAYWALRGVHAAHARAALQVGVTTALVASLLQLFPTGDQHGKLVAEYQKPSLAAMEGRFASGARAELAIIGEPDLEHHRLDNPIVVPEVLSFLAYGSFGATVYGLEDFPERDWPDNPELLYYAYHVMVGLGTLLLGLSALGFLLLVRGTIMHARWMLWPLLLAFPFPYIATSAGWITAELGRQPWLVYGLQRTVDGTSPHLHSGNVVFSTIGFCGLYFVLGLLFLYLVGRLLAHGPEGPATEGGH